MKVCVVCQYYHPEPFKIAQICERLAAMGHSVRVLTGLPNYPTGSVPNEYRWGRRRRETLNGVDISRVWEIPRGRGKLALLLNYLSFAVTACIRALAMPRDYDMVFVYQLSPVTMALPALLLKKRARRPLVLYCLDLWPESMKVMVPDERRVVYRLVKRLSGAIYRSCEAIAVSSPAFVQYLAEVHRVDTSRLSYLPQHSEDPGILPAPGSDPRMTRFYFTGNIGLAQGIDCILDAVELIGDALNYEVHFVGDGSYLQTAKQEVSARGIERHVLFHGRYPTERMPEFLGAADACLLTLSPGKPHWSDNTGVSCRLTSRLADW